MAMTRSEEFRARATQARRIAQTMQNHEGQADLRDMADALDAEADRLESHQAPHLIPPPTNDV